MKPEVSEKLFVESLFKNSNSDNSLVIDEQDLKVQKLTGDASTRKYYRIVCKKKSFVVCLDNPAMGKAGESSFIVLQGILSDHGIRVPKIYDSDLEKGYILEEDLGDRTLLSHLSSISSEDEEFETYKPVIDEMIRIHQIDFSRFNNYQFSSLKFDTSKLLSEVQVTIDNFVKTYLGIDLCEKDERSLLEEFRKICDEITKKPMVLVHRDFHSRNIMCKGGENIVIDFQDARLGLPQYDLVSLLDDCYYSLTEKNKNKLKEYYWHGFLKKSKGQTEEEFHFLYDIMLIQRVFKAIGSFSYIFNTRGDKRYLKYIGFGFEKLRKTLLKYSDKNNLRSFLSTIYYEN
jgi:aminoglycoside/choline kinase family phosphotransferase